MLSSEKEEKKVGSWQWASLPIGEFDFGINKDGLCLLCFIA